MAVRVFDSGEGTQFPSYAGVASASWAKVANQPSQWEVFGGAVGECFAGVSLSGQYSGNTCFRTNHASGSAKAAAMRRTAGAALSESYISFMVKLVGASDRDFFRLTKADGTTIVVRLNYVNASNSITVYAGTTPTLKATIAGISLNQYYNIRLHVKSGTIATAVLEISIDNATPIDCSGTAMDDWQYLVFGNRDAAAVSDTYFDCLQVNDTTGTRNNSWTGNPVIPGPSRPDADTAVTDWIRNTGGLDYACINEAQPDLDTTYVSSTVNGDQSIYGMSNISNPANTAIRAVCLTIVAKRADAASIIPLVKRGGTTVELTAVPVGVDYMTPIEVIMEQDPIASSDWTEANFNSTEFGFKHQVD